jgi:16S rRNA processing protein RimM
MGVAEMGARLEIGRIGAPHGLTGEVRVALHFSGSDALFQAERVWLVSETGAREYAVVSVRPHTRAVLLLLEGIADRNAAETLRGARVEVERSLLPPLDAGEYYLVDLVGAEVFAPEGRIGEVVGIATHPTADSIQVKLKDGRIGEQALTAPWVTRVDAEAKRIELATLDGMIL